MIPMAIFLEALVTLFPGEAGGRFTSIAPREGSYRPFLRLSRDTAPVRIRFIEGPPVVAPGDTARVVVELEGRIERFLPAGTELDLLERDAQVVGLMTIARFWPSKMIA